MLRLNLLERLHLRWGQYGLGLGDAGIGDRGGCADGHSRNLGDARATAPGGRNHIEGPKAAAIFAASAAKTPVLTMLKQ